MAGDDQYGHNLHRMLEDEGYHVTQVRTGKKALDALASAQYALLFTPERLDDMSGVELLSRVKSNGNLIEGLVYGDENSKSGVAEAIRGGAYDFIPKQSEPEKVRSTIYKALKHYQLSLSHNALQKQFQALSGFENLIGQSQVMQDVYRRIEVVSETTANVVITGESGTGKELVARAIHNKSSRHRGPFVALNCSAFPREILENELFGVDDGVYNGALKGKAGCFELAHGGTLLLDEVCEMPLETQAKLLTMLEERRFHRMGSKKEIEVDVRIISASNKRLEKALEFGTLREDIYYRLSVVEIELPPLRSRNGDVALLANEFLRFFGEKNQKRVGWFSTQAMDVINRYHWPGNVRELRNTIERAVVLCEGDIIHMQELPERILSPEGSSLKLDIPLGTSLPDAEREIILRTLEFAGNNKTHAARTLGISLKTLHNKLNLYRTQEYGVAM